MTSFSLLIKTKDAKLASLCSLRPDRVRIVEKPLVFIAFSHDLNSYHEKGALNHLPQTPSPRGGYTQREAWPEGLTGKMSCVAI